MSKLIAYGHYQPDLAAPVRKLVARHMDGPSWPSAWLTDTEAALACGAQLLVQRGDWLHPGPRLVWCGLDTLRVWQPAIDAAAGRFAQFLKAEGASIAAMFRSSISRAVTTAQSDWNHLAQPLTIALLLDLGIRSSLRHRRILGPLTDDECILWIYAGNSDLPACGVNAWAGRYGRSVVSLWYATSGYRYRLSLSANDVRLLCHDSSDSSHTVLSDEERAGSLARLLHLKVLKRDATGHVVWPPVVERHQELLTLADRVVEEVTLPALGELSVRCDDTLRPDVVHSFVRLIMDASIRECEATGILTPTVWSPSEQIWRLDPEVTRALLPEI